MTQDDFMSDSVIALTWCLAWGEQKEPKYELSVLKQMRQALINKTDFIPETQSLFEQVREIENKDLTFPKTQESLTQLIQQYSDIWNEKIGLVYGGATKIKQYVFESAKLPEIRGASAILDRINLVDLPAFFGKPKRYISTEKWLDKNFPNLKDALIPELIIYSTGGNILAFCPAAFVDDLANAIERRYTEETLTANSCAVGAKFKVLETRFGLLKDNIEETKWLDWYLQDNVRTNHLVEAYFGKPKSNETYENLFQNRKSFNELAGKLATLFNQRRSGNETESRPSRRYPPIFETHPYLQRDINDFRSAIAQVTTIPQQPIISETSARKLLVGQITKKIEQDRRRKNRSILAEIYTKNIYQEKDKIWKPGLVESWVDKYTKYINDSQYRDTYYYRRDKDNISQKIVQEARSLKEIGNASNGFVGYIYADGNNMGGYIQKIKTPQEYKNFSQDIFEATEKSVYLAIAEHLQPHQLKDLNDLDNENRNGQWIHPFEIITIGGDDVMLIVPANKALQIAKTLGEKFEAILLQEERLSGVEIYDNYNYQQSQTEEQIKQTHRYSVATAKQAKCQLSMSTGVLITSMNTPVYYAENLTNQLLKSAKKKAKELKKEFGYYGGTVDFLSLKSVTMISSNVEAFREEALVKQPSGKNKLKLYSAPYTLHELGGFIETVQAFKETKFPKSQLYQISSLLEKGKHTAILNYRYFKVRLKQGKDNLTEDFEEAWCQPKDENNKGNLAPWMSVKENDERGKEKTIYETIWREIVDIYPFIEKETETDDSQLSNAATQQEANK